MNVMLRSDSSPDVCINTTTWEQMDLKKLDQHIRTLQTARRWLKQQVDEKEKAVKK